MSAGRLSSISSQTLSQVLERQRLQSLSQPAPSSQLAQITRNLNLLRNGIAELESNEEVNAARPLREQWERMRKMLGAEGESLERYLY
jgi:syntaxin 8